MVYYIPVIVCMIWCIVIVRRLYNYIVFFCSIDGKDVQQCYVDLQLID